MNNGQIVYNSTPGGSPPTYPSGDQTVKMSSTGPIALNSVSTTGNVAISGENMLKGNAQSPNVIAPAVELIAKGMADYQGEVTFADSHRRRYARTTRQPPAPPPGLVWLPERRNELWSRAQLPARDNRRFTIASISPDGYRALISTTEE